jgi:hypothetical protein
MTGGGTLHFALDQNFPMKLIGAMQPFLPPNVSLTHVHKLDPAYPTLSDRQLILALSRTGMDGLISMNYRMLDQAEEVAAMVQTRLTMVFVMRSGHDPLRASGTLFLELPGIRNRIRPRASNIFRLHYEQRTPQEAWHFLQVLARRHDVAPDDLWRQHKPSTDEIEGPGEVDWRGGR